MNAEAFALELKIRQAMLGKQLEQLAQLVHLELLVPGGAAGFADGGDARDHGLARDAPPVRSAVWMSAAILPRVQVVFRLLDRSFSFQLQAGLRGFALLTSSRLNKAKSLNRPVGFRRRSIEARGQLSERALAYGCTRSHINSYVAYLSVSFSPAVDSVFFARRPPFGF